METSQLELTLMVIGLFALFGPAMWFGVTFLLSRLAGWHLLAAAYPEKVPFTGPTSSMISATVRGIGYNSVLTLGAGPDGLHVSTMLPFRPANKPLLIPWSEITASRTKRFLFDAVRLDFRSVPSVSMTFSRGTGEWLLQQGAGSGGSLT